MDQLLHADLPHRRRQPGVDACRHPAHGTPRPRAGTDTRYLAELQPHQQQPSDWNPEDKIFWAAKGRRIANRNLWISIPALLLAFAVWMVSVGGCHRPSAIGFKFNANELFWLAALPGLSGAVLRAFYAFMVPIFGGRVWTTLPPPRC